MVTFNLKLLGTSIQVSIADSDGSAAPGTMDSGFKVLVCHGRGWHRCQPGDSRAAARAARRARAPHCAGHLKQHENLNRARLLTSNDTGAGAFSSLRVTVTTRIWWLSTQKLAVDSEVSRIQIMIMIAGEQTPNALSTRLHRLSETGPIAAPADTDCH
jgi:hypothetical protein